MSDRHLVAETCMGSKAPAKPAPIARRLFHLFIGSLLPLSAMVLPMEIALALAATALVVSILGEALRFRFPALNRWLTSNIKVLLKQDEGTKILGSTYLLAGATLTMALFPKLVAVAALLFTTVGDPVAALVGERIGRRRIFRKSLEGSGAMLAVTLALGVGLSRIYPVPLLALVLGAVIATVAEALPIPVDDNLTIPLVSGGAILLLLSIFPVG